MKFEVNLRSTRAKRVRFGHKIRRFNSEGALWAVGIFIGTLFVYTLITRGGSRITYLMLAIALFYVCLLYTSDAADE